MRSFIKYLVDSRDYAALASAAVLIAMLIAAAMAPYLYPWKEIAGINLSVALDGPGIGAPLGYDELGRDLLGRIVWGARTSFIIALTSTAIAGLAGLLIGGLCGYFDGFGSMIVMRLIDIIISFPRTLLAIALVAVLGPGFLSLILAISISGIPIFARLTRGPILSIRQRDFITAARSLGANDMRIMLRHVLPNTLSVAIIQATIMIAESIMVAAGLSFLGLGPQPPTAEWGAMISQSRNHMISSPHLIVGPGIALFVTVLCINTLGDAIRDYLDPRGVASAI